MVGQPVSPADPGADRWCSVGRIHNIAHADPDSGDPRYDKPAVVAAVDELHAAMAWSDHNDRAASGSPKPLTGP